MIVFLAGFAGAFAGALTRDQVRLIRVRRWARRTNKAALTASATPQPGEILDHVEAEQERRNRPPVRVPYGG